MHNLRFAFAPGEEDPVKRLDKALSLCESIMNTIFENKSIYINIIFWQANDWRVSQAMLIVYDLINSSSSSEVKSTVKKGKLSSFDVNIMKIRYNFSIIEYILSILLFKHAS